MRVTHLISKRRCLAQHNVVTDIHTQCEHTRKRNSRHTRCRVLELHQCLDIVEHGTHDEHTQCDEGTGMVQQLKCVTV